MEERSLHAQSASPTRRESLDEHALTCVRDVRIDGDRASPVVRGTLWNASEQELVSIRLVYLPNVSNDAGAREAEDSGPILFCDLDVCIPPRCSRAFECRLPCRLASGGGELRVLSVVTRAPSPRGSTPRRRLTGTRPAALRAPAAAAAPTGADGPARPAP